MRRVPNSAGRAAAVRVGSVPSVAVWDAVPGGRPSSPLSLSENASVFLFPLFFVFLFFSPLFPPFNRCGHTSTEQPGSATPRVYGTTFSPRTSGAPHDLPLVLMLHFCRFCWFVLLFGCHTHTTPCVGMAVCSSSMDLLLPCPSVLCCVTF